MNQKTAKIIRYAAQRSLKKSPNNTGFTAHSTPVLRVAGGLGVTEKQARRAMRLACEKLSRTVPGWAQRLIHSQLNKGFARAEA